MDDKERLLDRTKQGPVDKLYVNWQDNRTGVRYGFFSWGWMSNIRMAFFDEVLPGKVTYDNSD